MNECNECICYSAPMRGFSVCGIVCPKHWREAVKGLQRNKVTLLKLQFAIGRLCRKSEDLLDGITDWAVEIGECDKGTPPYGHALAEHAKSRVALCVLIDDLKKILTQAEADFYKLVKERADMTNPRSLDLLKRLSERLGKEQEEHEQN